MYTYRRFTGRGFASRSEALGSHGMVATSQPLASQAGLEILQAGGNALDAALAANAMLGLVEPTGCGIGGDLFALVWEAQTRQLHGLNASGRSPQALHRPWLLEQGYAAMPTYGPLSVSVPGCVDGWCTLHERFGSLDLEQLFARTLQYAREGFPVTEVIAHQWAANAAQHGSRAGFRRLYMPGGQAPAKGERFANPELAHNLAHIARHGRAGFYQGEIAAALAQHVQAQGGFLSEADLDAQRSEWVSPISSTYHDWTLVELPPNTQGLAALQMLNILEPFPLSSWGFGSPQHLHTWIEAKKLAYEDRARAYADPEFSQIPLNLLLSKPYAQQLAGNIHPDLAAAHLDMPALEQGDTVYLCTADRDGNMVSLIQSNYMGMGSGEVAPGTGFCLQNRGALFHLADPHHPNAYAPGKRPFHTIIPAFVMEGDQPLISFGLMGGAMQPQGHTQVLTNLLDFGMNLQEAGDAPRIRHSGSSQPTGEKMTDGGVVYLEPGFSPESIQALLQKGHQLSHTLGGFGGYQAIRRDAQRGLYLGASESRKDGMAIGY